jgi:hypothetical protein
MMPDSDEVDESDEIETKMNGGGSRRESYIDGQGEGRVV